MSAPATVAPIATATAAAAAAAADVTAKPKKIKARPLHVRLHGEPNTVIVIPCDDVKQQPPKSAGTMYLCISYGTPAGCPRGTDCTEVHASTLRATKFNFHEKTDAWTCVEDVPYERFPTGEALEVAKPNAADELELHRPEHVLRTRAVEMPRRPLSHCAHFLWKGLCTRGAECEFIHALPFSNEPVATEKPAVAEHPAERSPVELPLERASQRESPLVRRYRHDPYDRSWIATPPAAPATPAQRTRRHDPYNSPWASRAVSRAVSRAGSWVDPAAASMSASVEDDTFAAPSASTSARNSGASTPATKPARARSPVLPL